MAGIAGITRARQPELVQAMLARVRHRGPAGEIVVETPSATLGVVWPAVQPRPLRQGRHVVAVWDGRFNGRIDRLARDCPLALAMSDADGTVLARDGVGVAPLYYGEAGDALAFASEAKALLGIVDKVREFPPGHRWDKAIGWKKFFDLRTTRVRRRAAGADVAVELRRRLESAVREVAQGQEIGAWLSGGLDSSALAALARPSAKRLHTFAGGLPGAPDLGFAREAAAFIGSEHHEVIVEADELPDLLPAVIHHLESFDALLVRSSVMNYCVAQRTARYVGTVLSGEGGDELFAGYEYLKALRGTELAAELVDITGRLHNTALQRVDRSAAAHGTVAHTSFLHPSVVSYALAIPPDLKLHHGVEKWILRQALIGTLPESVLFRPKAKFWEGAGVGDRLAAYAEGRISDADFRRERALPNGWQLNSKEELLYYRLFREQFGDLDDLEWMGRTKGVIPDAAPV